MTIVTVNDAKNVMGRRYCHKGMREFAIRHNLDFLDFVKNGIPADALRATGDAMAIEIADAAEARQAQEHERG